MIAKDPLESLIDSPLREAPATPPAGYTAPSFTEPCRRCGGSGRFGSWGACFACKGSGKKTFKTPPDQRRGARVAKKTRAVRTAEQNVEAFKAEHPAVFAWMDGSTFPFAVSLLKAVGKYGYLTENQLAAAERSIEKIAASRAADAQRVTEAKPVNLGALEQAFSHAARILKRPRVTVNGIKIYPAKADSKNAGALYVRSVADAVYLGKIQGGRFVRSRECSPEQETTVLAIAADPRGEAVKAGKLTGNCAVCSRTLSDPASVRLGIGPVCAENFGW